MCNDPKFNYIISSGNGINCELGSMLHWSILRYGKKMIEQYCIYNLHINLHK
ncbi:protein of unknown function [Mesotoga infera]|uniref:Uncharacterized protein n=1 Tax=Mesotoga infera TaxID=1236046 RepID=A0A7Z7LDD3_9BACT|nr:protein of unknown function [Mesotoga infera]